MLAVLSTARDTLHTNSCSILKIKNEGFDGTCTFLPFHLSSITHLLTGGNDFSCQGRSKICQTRANEKKKKIISEPQETISEIQSVSRNEFVLLHSCDLIQKRHNIPPIFLLLEIIFK